MGKTNFVFSIVMCAVTCAGSTRGAEFKECSILDPHRFHRCESLATDVVVPKQSTNGDCVEEFDPFAELEFDDDLHRRWYERFWTGKCNGFGLFEFCLENETSWFETINVLSAGLVEIERTLVQIELQAIGRVVGHEWSKRNDIRLIENQDLIRWDKKLLESKDLSHEIKLLCVELETLLRN